MDFEARKQKALAIMASRKMWKSNYAPPLIRLMWRLDGVADLGDAPLVRLQNKFYLGCVIWPDDGTVSSVATKGE